MQLTREQSERVAALLRRQRGNVRLANFDMVGAILFVAAKAGVLDRLFEHLQRKRPVRARIEALGLDSIIVKAHPEGTGALKKADRNLSAAAEAAGAPSFHLVAVTARDVLTWGLTPGQAGSAPKGRRLIAALGRASLQAARGPVAGLHPVW